MYIDIVPNRSSPPAVLLREDHRADGRTIKRTLANLSALPPEAVVALRAALKGERLVCAADYFVVEKSLPCGHVRAVQGTMERLAMTDLIASKPCRERDLVLAMVAQRVLRPDSKLATAARFADTTLAADFGVQDANEDDLYAAMDWVLMRQPFIEKKLAQRHLSAGGRVFYDLSSSSYYGSHCPLAARCHNRDGLKLPAIAYGLLTDDGGRPVAISVYPGNTGDPTTVPDQVDAMRKRFGIGRFVLVGDRGMLTSAQIEKLRKLEGCGWISCLRSGDIRKLLESRGQTDAPLFDQKNLAEIAHADFPGERLIACFNPLLAMDRDRTRTELLEATEKWLAKVAANVARRTAKPLSAAQIGQKVGRGVNRYKVAKHFALEIADNLLRWSRKEDSITREKALDGVYIIRTPESADTLSAEDAVRAYKQLGDVEKAFRTLKGLDLRMRPIHHRIETRVRAHMFLCMLAYYVEWHMREALAPLLFVEEDLALARAMRDPVARAIPSDSVLAKKNTKRSHDGLPLRHFNGLLSVLSTLCSNTCRVGEGKHAARFQRPTEATAHQCEAFRLLGVKTP
ncbi:MAG: IS1634 family transposase [bacterium]